LFCSSGKYTASNSDRFILMPYFLIMRCGFIARQPNNLSFLTLFGGVGNISAFE
jgi:hypothetical protein